MRNSAITKFFQLCHSGSTPEAYLMRNHGGRLAKLRSMPQTPEVEKEIQQIQDGLKCAYKAIAENNKIYFGIK